MFFFKTKSLSTRFIFLLSLMFVVGIGLSYLVLSRALTQRVQDEIVTRSNILVGLMNSVRGYTSAHIAPLLTPRLAESETFIPETVPAYSAREVFESLRKNPDYTNFLYKEATLNPTNPRDKSDEFETTILSQFRADTLVKSLSGYRTLNGIETFYSARPFAITSEACLVCHSTPDRAPASLIRTYGDQNGFNWKLNEITTAQIIYVPAEQVFVTARNVTLLVMAVFVGVYVLVLLLINFLVRRYVVQPLSIMGTIAQKVSAGDMAFTETERVGMNSIAARSDEIGQSARVFRQMTQDVQKREAQLTAQVQQLRVEVDHARKAKAVEEITESEYFQDLRAKAQALKTKTATNSIPSEDLY